MGTRITAEVAITLLRQAVKGKETFIYVSPEGKGVDSNEYHCEYAHGNRPGCLIGAALHLHGVPLGVLAKLPQNEIDGAGVAPALEALAGVSIDAPAMKVLANAQDAQDRGKTWGKALQLAEVVYAATLIPAPKFPINHQEEVLVA